jgi:hypothetical protein
MSAVEPTGEGPMARTPHQAAAGFSLTPVKPSLAKA